MFYKRKKRTIESVSVPLPTLPSRASSTGSAWAPTAINAQKNRASNRDMVGLLGLHRNVVPGGQNQQRRQSVLRSIESRLIRPGTAHDGRAHGDQCGLEILETGLRRDTRSGWCGSSCGRDPLGRIGIYMALVLAAMAMAAFMPRASSPVP